MARAKNVRGFGALFGAAGCLAATTLAAACYSEGAGVTPPTQNFYFPVGLAVSAGGNVLYAVNSDFDLQYNGGTLQSYDLHRIRLDAVKAIKNPADPTLPLAAKPNSDARCPDILPERQTNGEAARQPLGQVCAPPVDSTKYVKDSAIIGAFATDLLLSKNGTRLFSPVRGDTSLTWADVAFDDPQATPPEGAAYAPFSLGCGARTANRCATDHQAGSNPNEVGNTRHITMPGEPFGLAESEDGESIVVAHQTETRASLFSTGLKAGQATVTPALQFVVDGVPAGGNGVVAVPHDPEAFPLPACLNRTVRPASRPPRAPRSSSRAAPPRSSHCFVTMPMNPTGPSRRSTDRSSSARRSSESAETQRAPIRVAS